MVLRKLMLPLIVSLALAGCKGPDKNVIEIGAAPNSFPPAFLFGAAVAGFQSDMGCPTLAPEICTDDKSDWYQYVTSPEMVADGANHLSGEDPAVVGPGFWELYESDIDLAANGLKHNAFRMSIEWSRIFPESTTGAETYEELEQLADAGAIEHYRKIFEALKKNGLTPLVTIHHYTMPAWLHDGVACHLDFDNCRRRGWLDRETAVREIAKYAGFIARRFGDYVDLWATQNEPFAVILPGYIQPSPERINPPAVFLRIEESKEVLKAMIEGHARMYDAVAANDLEDADGDGIAASTGLIYAMAPAYPKEPDNEIDRTAAENVFYLWNMAFLNAIGAGLFDAELDGATVYREDLDNRLDWIGLNYKVVIFVEGVKNSIMPALSPLLTFNPDSLDIEQVYPEGLYDMAALIWEKFKIPIIVTENNGQHVKKGDMSTEIKYVIENLLWASRAIADGIDLRGYFYWSLHDNYEWNHGMSIELGLYDVDHLDPLKPRTPRELVDVYAEIAETGKISDALIEKHNVRTEREIAPPFYLE